MHSRGIFLAVGIFIFIVVGMFSFAYLKRTEQTFPTPTENVVPSSTAPVPYGIERVEAKHYYIDGVHTFAGIIDMPTPCDLLVSDVIVRESSPEQIELAFSVVNNAESCVQVITPQRFKVSASASKDAIVTATFGGIPVTLNLIPAAAGERPEEFELFIKG
jgi:hypothetical protein